MRMANAASADRMRVTNLKANATAARTRQRVGVGDDTAPEEKSAMRILTVTSLWPNDAQPNHGIFVENRMARVHATGQAEVTVIAPVPWFPSNAPVFGSYARFADVPTRATRNGISIEHPRYATIPKVGMRVQPTFYHAALVRCAKRLIAKTGPFDLIDAHYFYPDGVAAARLADELNLPLTITARGTDINLIPRNNDTATRAILAAAARAEASITVCEALRAEMIALGADGARVHTLRNGVDLDGFRPPEGDRSALKLFLGIPATAPLAVSVGGLVERKGHHLTIEAVAARPDLHLLIAGAGPEESALTRQIAALGVGDRIRLTGPLPHSALADFYGAADLSILSSSREGWANVLLESMACGTPVVATDAWGTPEVIAAYEAGRLARRDAGDIGTQIDALRADMPARSATRAYAEGFSWDETVEGVLRVFGEAIATRHGHRISRNGA